MSRASDAASVCPLDVEATTDVNVVYDGIVDTGSIGSVASDGNSVVVLLLASSDLNESNSMSDNV